MLRGCPDANMNYSDAGCDDYDRIARMFICDEDGSNCLEITKWITPFDRQPHSLTDITPLLASFRRGGEGGLGRGPTGGDDQARCRHVRDDHRLVAGRPGTIGAHR